MSDGARGLLLFSPAGALRSVVPLRRAAKRLAGLGFAVTIDPAATLKDQRFAGDDETRLAALHRVAAARPQRRTGDARRLWPDAPARSHRVEADRQECRGGHALGRE